MDKEKENAVEMLRRVFELADKGAFDNVEYMYAVRFGIEAVQNGDYLFRRDKYKQTDKYEEIMKGIPAGCFDIGQGIRGLTKDDRFLDPEYNGNMDFFYILEDLIDEYEKVDCDYSKKEMKIFHEELVKLFKRFHYYKEIREEDIS